MQKKLIRYCLSLLFVIAIGYTGLRILDNIYPPDVSRYQQLSGIVTDKHGQWLYVSLSKDDKYRLHSPSETLSEDYRQLLMIYEDKDFLSHHGIDYSAIIRAAWQNLTAGNVVSGASTLTMQTAKLLEPRPRTFRSKIIELFRAWQLERRFSKAEILTMYATLAPVGRNLEGLTAAAYYYFDKPVNKLSLSESAWLVALPQSPKKLADGNIATAIAARNKVLQRAFDARVIDKQRYRQAIAEPLTRLRIGFPKHAPHHSQIAKKNHVGQQLIATSLDKSLQRQLEHQLYQSVKQQPPQTNLAAAILDNDSGQWLAYVGSADFLSTARLGQVDMLRAVRSPGSALKPFITLLAFDWLRYHPMTTIDDVPLSDTTYRPSNYDGRFQGRLTLAQALVRSRNVPAVKLMIAIRPEYFSEHLQSRGLAFFYPKGGRANASIALGGVGVRGVELAKLYRQLAQCSYQSAPHPLSEQRACRYVTHILQQSQDGQGRIRFGRAPVAFKTGTSYGWRDRWLFAYTKNYTIVLWGGRADGQFSEQRASAELLIPLLRQVVALLPNPPLQAGEDFAPKRISTADLPRRLRHVGGEHQSANVSANVGAATHVEQVITHQNDSNALTIVAPLHQGVIDFSRSKRLAFRIRGGTPPFIYLLNNRLLEQTPKRTLTYETPMLGSYQLLVIDANGSSQTAHFRLIDTRKPTLAPDKRAKLTPIQPR